MLSFFEKFFRFSVILLKSKVIIEIENESYLNNHQTVVKNECKAVNCTTDVSNVSALRYFPRMNINRFRIIKDNERQLLIFVLSVDHIVKGIEIITYLQVKNTHIDMKLHLCTQNTKFYCC